MQIFVQSLKCNIEIVGEAREPPTNIKVTHLLRDARKRPLRIKKLQPDVAHQFKISLTAFPLNPVTRCISSANCLACFCVRKCPT